VSAPEAILSSQIQTPMNTVLPGFPQATLLTLADIAARGSAAITAVVDVQSDQLHVANCGDSRALAGWYHPSTGQWRCEVLSDDLEPENPVEADR
jgi:pyruvate dehydrogenase phosphatase